MPQRLVPFLGYGDAAAAIDWLCAAFGANENAEARSAGADGTIWHAELDIGGTSARAHIVSAARSSAGCMRTHG